VFCDVWGVVHDGRRAFPDAVAALSAFRAAGGRVVLLTNVPKLRAPIPGQLDRIGVPRDAWDVVVTSGDAIRAEIAARAPGPMHVIGMPGDTSLWADLDIDVAPLERARFLMVTGLADFENGEPAHHAEELAAARARDLEMVCANPDVVVRFGERLHWCAGALARDYEALGGRVVLAGKPHPPIYALAYAELERLAGRAIDRSRILAIGDGPSTDVLGANREGLDCLFVASGIHGRDLVERDAISLERVARVLVSVGASATFVTTHLV
jgi:HAD superfamily hydrolase (TIGR01459 family)